jgi:hypothetical protein
MSPKKRPGFVRTTISLPAELRRRMRACGENVNWSAVAARAFKVEVARQNSQKRNVDIESVVARLRTTDNPSRSELFEAGRLQGEKWAQRQATAKQLRALHAKRREARAKSGADVENWLSVIDNKRPPVDVLSQIVGIEEKANRSSEAQVLMKSSEFVHGFAAGALHIWKQVARRLRCDF